MRIPSGAVTTHQGGTQGSVTGRYVVFPYMVESKGCRECSAPTLVTHEEGGLLVSNLGTGISPRLTLIGIHIIMG